MAMNFFIMDGVSDIIEVLKMEIIVIVVYGCKY